MRSTQSRRQFLTMLSLAGVARLVAAPAARAGEGPLETTTVRLGYIPAACDAPVHAAADLLHAEGFTDVRFVTAARGRARLAGCGKNQCWRSRA